MLVGASGGDLLVWRDTSSPERAWSAPTGVITYLLARPGRAEVALTTTSRELWAFDVTSGTARKLVADVLASASFVFSPDGGRIALPLGVRGATLIAVDTGEATPIAGAIADSDPFSWDADGIVFMDHEPGSFSARYRFWRCAGPMVSLDGQRAPWWTSSDGSVRVSCGLGGWRVRTAGTERPIAMIEPSFMPHLEPRAPWAGPHRWVVDREPLVLVDFVRNASTELDPEYAKLETASADGTTLVLRRNERLFAAEIDERALVWKPLPDLAPRSALPSSSSPRPVQPRSAFSPTLSRARSPVASRAPAPAPAPAHSPPHTLDAAFALFVHRVRSIDEFDSELLSSTPLFEALAQASGSLVAFGEPAIERLIAALEVEAPKGLARAAAHTLGTLGPAAIGAYDALRSRVGVTDDCAAACVAIDPARAVRDRVLMQVTPASRRPVMNALARTATGCTALTEALRDASEEVRREAVEALAHSVLDPIVALAPALHDPDTRVRAAAMSALAVIADPRAVDALLDALCHYDGPPDAVACVARDRRAGAIIDAIVRRDVSRVDDPLFDLRALPILLPGHTLAALTRDALVRQVAHVLVARSSRPRDRAYFEVARVVAAALGDRRLIGPLVEAGQPAHAAPNPKVLSGIGWDALERGESLPVEQLRAVLLASAWACPACRSLAENAATNALVIDRAVGHERCKCGMDLRVVGGTLRGQRPD